MMRRIYPTSLAVVLMATLGWGSAARAQPAGDDDDEEMTFDPDDPAAPKDEG